LNRYWEDRTQIWDGERKTELEGRTWSAWEAEKKREGSEAIHSRPSTLAHPNQYPFIPVLLTAVLERRASKECKDRYACSIDGGRA
jgi:hypothetical protein